MDRVCSDCGSAVSSQASRCECGSKDLLLAPAPASVVIASVVGSQAMEDESRSVSATLAPAFDAGDPAGSTDLATAGDAAAVDVPRYLQVTTTKLAVMSILTFGIYTTYWFYKQWRAVQRARKPKISPFWRTVFSMFFAGRLFAEVEEDALDHDIQPRWNPYLLSSIYLTSYVVAFFPVPFNLLCVAGPLVVLPVQRTILAIADKSGLSFPASEGYSVWNIFGMLLGAFLWWSLLWGLVVMWLFATA